MIFLIGYLYMIHYYYLVLITDKNITMADTESFNSSNSLYFIYHNENQQSIKWNSDLLPFIQINHISILFNQSHALFYITQPLNIQSHFYNNLRYFLFNLLTKKYIL